MIDQEFENRKLTLRQIEPGSTAVHAFLGEIDGHIAEFEPAGPAPFCRRAAEQGLNASQQLCRVERFCEIVVGPDLQTVHFIGCLAASRKDKDWRGDTFFSYMDTYFETIHAGQHDVQNDQVVPFTENSISRNNAILGPLDEIVLAF